MDQKELLRGLATMLDAVAYAAEPNDLFCELLRNLPPMTLEMIMEAGAEITALNNPVDRDQDFQQWEMYVASMVADDKRRTYDEWLEIQRDRRWNGNA